MYIYIYTYIYISIPVYAFLLTSLPLLRGSLQREVLQRALELVLVVRGGAFFEGVLSLSLSIPMILLGIRIPSVLVS